MINYSRTLVFYNLFFGYLLPYAVDPDNQERLRITDDQRDKLIELKTEWDLAFGRYGNPVSYGKLSIATIGSCYRTCKKFTEGLTQQLKNDKSINLLELDYMIFYIHKDEAKTKIPKPTETSAVILRGVTHLNNEFQAFNIANSTSGAKPKYVTRIKVVMLVLGADEVAPTIDMLVAEMESGSMRFDIPFTEDQIGMIAYIAVCFSNDAGDGEYSAIIACPII